MLISILHLCKCQSRGLCLEEILGWVIWMGVTHAPSIASANTYQSGCYVARHSQPDQPCPRNRLSSLRCTRSSWLAVAASANRPSLCSSCTMRWVSWPFDPCGIGFDLQSTTLIFLSGCSLLRTMSPRKQTRTGRRLCWTGRRCRLIFWIRPDRRIMQLSGEQQL